MAGSVFCGCCGAQLPDEAVFCSKCGKKVSDVNPTTLHESDGGATDDEVAKCADSTEEEATVDERPWPVTWAFFLGAASGVEGFLALSFLRESSGLWTWVCIGLCVSSLLMLYGINWARIMFTVVSGYVMMISLLSISALCNAIANGGDDSDNIVEKMLLLLFALVIAVVFSWLPPANAWFRSVAAKESASEEGNSQKG